MSNPILHIKDSYYFEVPTALWKVAYTDKAQFPDVWVKNDDQFQGVEFGKLYDALSPVATQQGATLPSKSDLEHAWRHWQHEGENHANFAKPFDQYVSEGAAKFQGEYLSWRAQEGNGRKSFDDYLALPENASREFAWFAKWQTKPDAVAQWKKMTTEAGGKEAVAAFKNDSTIHWDSRKLANYNHNLSGKILIPQPFGELRNMYEPESGFCVSKLLLMMILAGVVLFAVFGWLGGKVSKGAAPKGRLWNLLEVFLLFIRDQIARPAIGAHHEEHDEGHDEHAHAKSVHGHEVGEEHAHEKHGHDAHGGHKKDHGHHSHNPYEEADGFVPLLWTIFFFVLTCNLFGLVPWLGGPTATFAVTGALAFITFLTVVVSGMRKWGFAGFFLNQIPSMDLPAPLAIVLKPMIFAIEILGLLIKHLVLSIRLLANMVAGHLVILGIMALAFGAQGAITARYFDSQGQGWMWYLVATISIASATAFNILELFVAFLQAYIFTFLSALFIGASVHKH